MPKGQRKIAADGEPEPDHPLNPTQLAVRRVLIHDFDHDRQAMAEATGISEATLSNYVLGKQSPPRRIVERIETRLRIALINYCLPDDDAVYFRGARIGKNDRGYRQIVGNIQLARPDLAKKLGL